MDSKNLDYIANLKVDDVPWHRLTTTYGRASDFPELFKVLFEALEVKNNALQNGRNFELSAVKTALDTILNQIEHQSTLWHATPFALIFLTRIFMRALAVAHENKAAKFISDELAGFFAFILKICDDGEQIEHDEPLAQISDMLDEKYLWSEIYDEDADYERWEDGFFYEGSLFYSFYHYSRMVLMATGINFA